MMARLLFILLVCTLNSIGANIYAQSPATGQLKNSVWKHNTSGNGSNTNISLNIQDYSLISTVSGLSSKVNEAFVKVAFSPKQDKFLNKNYDYTLTFDLVSTNATNLTKVLCASCKLTVRNQIANTTTAIAEKQLISDVKSLLFENNAYKNIQTIELRAIKIINNITPTIPVTALELANLDIFLEIAVGYGAKVSSNTPPTNVAINGFSHLISNKTVTFSWAATPYIPNYEIEVLRLNNKSELDANPLRAQILAEEAVVTNIDWSKALRIETQSNQLSTNLTLAEGKGFYIWRMRPIGNYEPNGSGNSKNHGIWSFGNQGTLTIQRTSGSPTITVSGGSAPNIFFFADPDNDINNIYSRTFTEGNRNKEVISYANGLQQSKQTQSYIPSQKTQVTVQTIYDNLGRPVITTLPVPTEAMSGTTNTNVGLKGYKKKFVQNNDNLLYNPEDFDVILPIPNGNKLKNPDPIKGAGTDFDYYSGKNNVADAEGYPFTRTLYYNDGVGRVKEQSGVGKKHAIGESAEKGKTVKTYYSTSSEHELTRLLGKEAPDAKSVLKTITVDQNNIASITYTSKEGKVIATSLAIFDGAATSPLLGLDSETGADNEVKDFIKSDTKNGEKTANTLIASRRMAFGERTTLKGINYTLNCNNPNYPLNKITIGCFEFDPNAEFIVEVVIRKIDEPWTSTPSSWTALADKGTTPPEDKIFTIVKSREVSCANTGADFGDITLEAGSYIIEKRLTLKPMEVNVTDISNKDVAPFAGLIKSWLEDIKCSKDFAGFYVNVELLKTRLVAASALPTSQQQTAAFAAIDILPEYASRGIPTPFFTKYHEIEKDGFDAIILSTKCCKGIKVLIGNISPFDCDNIKLVDVGAPATPTPTYVAEYLVNPFFTELPEKTEFFPDFEGYAYSYFWDCVPESKVTGTSSVIGGLPYPEYVYEPVITDLGKLRRLFKGTDAEFNALGADNDKLAYFHNRIKYIYHKVLKDQMSGWHTPGTFNSMIYHMLTDKYSTDGMEVDATTGQDVVVKTKPAPLTDECGVTIYPNFKDRLVSGTNGGNITHLYYNNTNTTATAFDAMVALAATVGVDPTALGREKTTQYYCADLFKSWSSNLAFVKNSLGGGVLACPNDIVMELQENGNTLSQQADEINGASGTATGLDSEGAEKLAYHLVAEFLNAAGYRFAKIITDFDEKPLSDDEQVSTPAAPYTYPKPKAPNFTRNAPYANPQPTYSGTPLVKYKPIVDILGTPFGGLPAPVITPGWEVWQNSRQLFRSIKNPIYAFKYFEYKEGTLSEVEMSTCFADPNWKKVDIGTATAPNIRGVFLKTGGNLPTPTAVNDAVGVVSTTFDITNTYEIDPDRGSLIGLPAPTPTSGNYYINELCELCGIGYVKCKITHKLWSQGQRYTFYALINATKPGKPVDWNNSEESAKDFASVGYVRKDPDPNTVNGTVRNFYLWEDETTPLNAAQYQQLVNVLKFEKQGKRLKTKVELDLANFNSKVNTWCEQKRDAIREMLKAELDAKCYIRSNAYCRVDLPTTASAQEKYENDRIISDRDIELLVDMMVNECKVRGMLTTYRRSSTGCRDVGAPVKLPDGTFNLGFKDPTGKNIEKRGKVEYGVGKGDEKVTAVPANKYDAEIYKRKIVNNALGGPNDIDIMMPSNNANNTMKTDIFVFDPMTSTYGIKQGVPVLDLTPVSVVAGAGDSEEFDAALHNYCQWNKRRQVLEMILKAKLKSFCDGDKMVPPYVPTSVACPNGDCNTMPAMPGQVTTPNQPYSGPPNTDVNGGTLGRVIPGKKVQAKVKVVSGQETLEVSYPTTP